MTDSLAHGESALRYVTSFEHNYGQQLLNLAFHVALPVVINADLVHLLRINFFLDPPDPLPYTAEADLLLSSLCYDIGDGLYEIAPKVRNILLQMLVKEYPLERIREIATLLWQYNERYAPWGDRLELERAQQLTVLNFLDPLKARQWLAEAEISLGPDPSVEREWFVAMWKEIEQIEHSFKSSHQAEYTDIESEDTNDFNEMEALLAASTTPVKIKRGDVVDGVIVRIDRGEILVDIGLQSEGVLSTKELPASGDWSLENLHVNDRVLVYVIQPESPDGHALLSLKRANAERQWRVAEEQYKNNELLQARVIDYNKGGLIVDVASIRGFVPISQILNLKREEVAQGGDNRNTAAKLASMKDKVLQLKIIEINRARNRLILSERLASQEWRQRRREELLDELKPGEVRTGVVSNLANFGAFVDLGGADGLVHISQLTWSRVNHPSEVLKVGQEVEVQVLSVDKEKKKIMLSIKRAEVDPWTTVEQRYFPGQIVTGTITKIAPFGAFARIEEGVEGLIHQSELTPGMDPRTNLREGQELQLRILRIDAERHRLGLSLRQAEAQSQGETLEQLPSAESGDPASSLASREDSTWPGPDENEVIDSMLANSDSPHWGRCLELVEGLVQQRASDLSADEKDEITQIAMSQIVQSLPNFKRRSKLFTWITSIVDSCVADTRRLLLSLSKQVSTIKDTSDDTEDQESEDEYAASELGRTPPFQQDTLIDSEGFRDPAFELEFREVDPDFLARLADAILALPHHQMQAVLLALKEDVADSYPLISALKTRGIDIETVSKPEEQSELIRLRASLSVARKKLRMLPRRQNN